MWDGAVCWPPLEHVDQRSTIGIGSYGHLLFSSDPLQTGFAKLQLEKQLNLVIRLRKTVVMKHLACTQLECKPYGRRFSPKYLSWLI